MVHKDMENDTEVTGDQSKTIQTVTISKNYLKESWRPEETCYDLDFNEKPPVKTDVKNS